MKQEYLLTVTAAYSRNRRIFLTAKEHREKFLLGKEEFQKPAPCGNYQREQSGGGTEREVCR